jgi:hypothetical protein
MDLQPPFAGAGTAPLADVRTAHETLDRFAAAYPDAIQALSAWIAAQLQAQVDENGAFPAKGSAHASSGERYMRSTTCAERSDILAPVIKAAGAAALDPTSPQSVWAIMVRMAEDRQPPLLGFSSDGIQYAGRQYQAEGVPDVLTFKNLADRMRRRRKHPP